MKLAPLACSLALLFTAPVFADDEPPAAEGAGQFGHSSHGEAFNEGPRIRGVLMPGTGKVQFPVKAGVRMTTDNLKHAAAPYEFRPYHYSWQAPDVSKFEGRTFNG
ncbi:MAG: hypothetical protein EOO38_15830, partial [Cytophagaceae bacterium]